MFGPDDDVAVLACSHRRAGNSDAAAELVARGVREAGAGARIVSLRQYEVLPCLACRACAADALSRCVLAAKDDAEGLFDVLLRARAVVVASPIYFYGLPSRAKTWIDRGQRFWEARRKGDEWLARTPERRAYACFVAGQPTGERLFDGARLTLKYFLANFGLTLAEPPLGLRGMDAAGDLLSNPRAAQAALELGRSAGKAARGHA